MRTRTIGKSPITLLLGIITLIGVATGSVADTGFLDRSMTVDGHAFRYQVYVPAEWTRQQTWPVILYLHGGSSVGTDGALPTAIGLGAAIRNDRTRFPAVVVFPQMPLGEIWATPAMQRRALAALDAALSEFNGDADRVYGVGISLGAQGVLRIASRGPTRFAAIVSVAGRINPAVTGPTNPPANAALDTLTHPYLKSPDPFGGLAAIIKVVPVWLFHGDADARVPVEEPRKLAAALKAVGGNVRYTEYPGVNHNSWEKAFEEPELMPWLLGQQRKKE